MTKSCPIANGQTKHSEDVTHDVVHAERTGAMLQQPGVHTLLVEFMGTGDDP